ncbi:uncharacterized protein LOC131160294 [Malania oleifera]|uniref:uncharacterized protein LOC131160294 n=1 Tax=Malania oleifera TaxID=397392 RepID=UPI0025ADE3DE|nr:uncharacterized protein LOC131160294 [Malania oleifera]
MSERELMELDEEENDFVGKVPEFGAIFMSNTATKRECFRRKIFGLPSSQACFVKQVKAGMVLFLFEFEKRQLYGVFQACSDGAINIVPHAYRSSGKQFPAQVQFSTIWYCNPLPENEFRAVIEDNYYASNKFNFGLSKYQVHKLLSLFRSRKLEDERPQIQLTRNSVTKSVGNSLDKGRRRDDDSMLLMSNTVKNEHNLNIEPGTVISGGKSGNSWRKIRSIADYGRFSERDRVKNEHNVDYDHGFAIPIYPGNSLDDVRRAANDGEFATSERVGNQSYPDSNCQVISTECCGNFWGDLRRATDDGRLSTSDEVGSGHNRYSDCVRGTQIQYCLDRGIRVADVGRLAIRNGVGNIQNVDNDLGPIPSTEYLRDSIVKEKRVVGGYGSFVTKESAMKEHNLHGDLESVVLTEDLEDFGVETRMMSDDDSRFVTSNSIRTNADNDCRPVSSTECSGSYHQNINPLGCYGKPIQDMDNISVLDKLRPSSALHSSTKPQIPSLSYFTYHKDAVIKRTDHYDPEASSHNFRCSPPFGDNHGYNLAHQCVPYNGKSADNSFPQSKFHHDVALECATHYSYAGNPLPPFENQLFPSHLEPNAISKCLDVPSDPWNYASLPAPSHQKHSYPKGAIPSSSPGSCKNREVETFDIGGYKDVSFSESSCPVTILDNQNYSRKAMSCSLGLSKKSSFMVDHGYPSASEAKFEHKRQFSETFRVESKCDLQGCACSLQSRSLYCNEHKSPGHDVESMHSNHLKSRTSVFSRLTSAPKLNIQENDSHIGDGDGEYDMDVEDIMKMLDRNHLCWTKARNYKHLIQKHNNVENWRIKKQTFHSHKERDCSEMLVIKQNADVTEEVYGNHMAEGTPLLDFKRRSELLKNMDKNKTKGCCETADSENKMLGHHKRRRLVRPNFSSNESGFSIYESFQDKGIVGDLALNLHQSSNDSCFSKENTESHKAVARSHGNEDNSSQNVALHSVMGSSDYQGSPTDKGRGTKHTEKNGESGEVSLRSECEDGTKLSEDIGAKNASLFILHKDKGCNSQEGSTVEDLNVDELCQNRSGIIAAVSNV